LIEQPDPEWLRALYPEGGETLAELQIAQLRVTHACWEYFWHNMTNEPVRKGNELAFDTALGCIAQVLAAHAPDPLTLHCARYQLELLARRTLTDGSPLIDPAMEDLIWSRVLDAVEHVVGFR
jgi:hypothetical protein